MASGQAWISRCKKWVSADGSLYSNSCTYPAPSKSFGQVFVTDSEVIYRMWRILPPTRADSNQVPTSLTSSYNDFFEDERMRSEIERAMGARELYYLDHLISGYIDYLNRLPRKVLLNILLGLDLITITRLGQVNKLFQQVCSCEPLWSKIYMEHTRKPVTNELLLLVDQKGWKEVFFMNKLQLQMLLRRQVIMKPSRTDQTRFFYGNKFRPRKSQGQE